MTTLSLALIVKNTEKTLDRCLSSFKPAVNEIIIVDTGSTDRTVEIAKKYTDKIYHFDWIEDFSAARNYSFDQCTQDFILWVDGDDYALPEDIERLKALDYTGKDMIICNYVYASDEFGVPSSIVPRERIVRRSLGVRWQEAIHEYLPLTGKMEVTDILIPRHNKQHGTSERNLKTLELVVKKDPDNPRVNYYYGIELVDAGRSEEGLPYLEKFVTMPGAFWEDVYRAHYRIAEDYFSKDEGKFKNHVFKSLEIEERRAEPYYLMGRYWETKQQWDRAIQWYSMCHDVRRPSSLLAAYQKDYYTWMPCLQLCVCYNAIGDVQKAYEWNEKALEYRPGDTRMLSNRKILLDGISVRKAKVSVKIDSVEENFRIGWVSVNNWDAAQTRIRVLKVNDWLRLKGYRSDIVNYSDVINQDYLICVVGKSFSETDYNAVRDLKKSGRIIVCDLCEQIVDFPWVKEILSLSDLVVCCSRELSRIVQEKANKNTVVIEDAYERN